MIDNAGLGARAVACTQIATASGKPKWRWKPGMTYRGDAHDANVAPVIVDVSSDGTITVCEPRSGWVGIVNPHYIEPDFEHGGTRGLLLDLVREAFSDLDITTRSHGDVEGETLWDVVTPLRFGSRCLVHSLCSEAKALVAALEAAPCSTL